MQLITTNTVMSKVVDELDLFCNINELKWGNGKTYKINKTYLDMLDPVFRSKNSGKFIVPEKFEILLVILQLLIPGEFIIKKETEDTYVLFDAVDNRFIKINLFD